MAPKVDQVTVGSVAFANVNVSPSRPVYFEVAPPEELLRPDYVVVPAGAYFVMTPKPGAQINSRYWASPFEAEDVVPWCRRERGQHNERSSAGVFVRPVAYERRLIYALLQARKNLADWLARSSDPAKLQRSAELYESLPQTEPEYAHDITLVLPLGIVWLRLKQPARAEPWLRKMVALEAPSPLRARAMIGLVEVCLASDRAAEAGEWKARALAIPDLEEELRKRLESLR
jgi:hypothetical protein